jgi:hypothetical protein
VEEKDYCDVIIKGSKDLIEKPVPVQFPRKCIICMKPAYSYKEYSGIHSEFLSQWHTHFFVSAPVCKEHFDIEEKVMHEPYMYRGCLFQFLLGLPVISLIVSLCLMLVDIVDKGDPANPYSLSIIADWKKWMFWGSIIVIIVFGVLYVWDKIKWYKRPENIQKLREYDEYEKMEEELLFGLKILPAKNFFKTQKIILRFQNKKYAEEFKTLNRNIIVE